MKLTDFPAPAMKRAPRAGAKFRLAIERDDKSASEIGRRRARRFQQTARGRAA